MRIDQFAVIVLAALAGPALGIVVFLVTHWL